MYIELEYKILQLTTVRKCTLYNHDCSAQYTDTVSNSMYTILYYFQILWQSNFVRGKNLKFSTSINLPWGHVKFPQKNLGPISPAVLTFNGYKQTKKQTNKQTNKHPNKQTDKVEYTVKL